MFGWKTNSQKGWGVHDKQYFLIPHLQHTD